MNTALVVVDIQNDYFAGGRNPLVNPDEAAAEAAKALGLFRKYGWPLFHVRHVNNRPDASFFLPNSEGAEIHASVAPLAGEPVIVKHRPDSFFRRIRFSA